MLFNRFVENLRRFFSALFCVYCITNNLAECVYSTFLCDEIMRQINACLAVILVSTRWEMRTRGNEKKKYIIFSKPTSPL